jgi:hypothetical protein
LQLDWTCPFGSVKAILQLKKLLNLGEVTDHSSIIADKLLELEDTFSDDFDENIKYLTSTKNKCFANCTQNKA